MASPSRVLFPLLASTPSLALSAVGLALAGSVPEAAAQSADGGAIQLPPVSVEAAPSGDYKVDQPSLPKLTQPLRDTPQTVETVSRQLMDDQGVATMRDALRNVPGISLAAGEYGAQGDNLTIRGFTARNDIYLDGMRDFGSYYRDPFYLDGIQVLKGPSSILFGRGSTGGVVEQDGKSPQLAPLTAGTLGFGTDATKRLTADVNRALPDLGPGTAIRLNVMGHESNVAGRDVTQNDRFGFAPSFAVGLGTPTRLTLSYLHQTEYDVPDYGLPWLYQSASGVKSATARPASVSGSNFYGFEHGDYLRTNVDVGTVKLEHDVGSAIVLRDQFRYAHYTRQFRITEPQIYGTTAAGATGSSILVSPSTSLGSLNVSRNQLYGDSVETFLQNQADVTLNVRTGPIAHALVTGFEVGQETSDPNRNSTIGPYSTTSLVSPDPAQAYNANTYRSSMTSTTADTLAAYALDTITLDEHWQVMGGVRFDRFDASFDQTTYANPVTGRGAGALSFSRVDDMVSWRGALVFKPLPNGSIYFSAGTSFNPSAEAISLQSSTASLAPERNETYEIGSKWDLFGESLTLNGALYHTEKLNQRETDPNNSSYQILAGDAVAKGVELEAIGRLTDRWQVSGGYAYTYSEIVKSPNTSATSDLGRPLANVPRHSGNVWTTYKLPWLMQIGGGVNYVSSRFASATPSTVGGVNFWKQVPSYWTANAMAKYPLTDNVSLQLNVYNITNKFYYDQLHPSHVVPGPGRSALFTISYKY
ncbi:TonB-dependent receptor [Telmatospirillum siberiense]|uniref:TonB-dependent siderophore receptor n=1 Tax=Telmatospirillum siberiense TaxID=382514 RepID=A0A2N3PZ05_9PROT|nr:TonB-dependent siderophore receptor [Telmatospirillum siberiense]PKU25628.1 TonB-dependent siderophore receptor [Telmatospirillum siberiense]